MELLLNNILNLTEQQINNSKIEFNMNIGKGGMPFIDRWLKCSETERISGILNVVLFGDGMVSSEIFIQVNGHLVF